MRKERYRISNHTNLPQCNLHVLGLGTIYMNITHANFPTVSVSNSIWEKPIYNLQTCFSTTTSFKTGAPPTSQINPRL